MLVEATADELYDMLPSLEKLTPKRLKEVCEEQANKNDVNSQSKSMRKSKHYKIENCIKLTNPYYCHVNKAILRRKKIQLY